MTRLTFSRLTQREQVKHWPRRYVRFLSDFPDTDGCVAWPFNVDDHGYGRAYWWDGAQHVTSAHRLTYIYLIGELAEGPQLDHLCRNRICVNPRHLEPVTAYTNTLRSRAPSAATMLARANAGTCARGHDYPAGAIQCPTCNRDAQRKRDLLISQARELLGLTQKEYTARYGRSGRTAAALIGGKQ